MRVSERFDHVVGRNAHMRRAVFDHLQHALKHADHGAERTVLALVEAPQPVEVAEELVRAVDEMNDHERCVARGRCGRCVCSRPKSSCGSIGFFTIARTPAFCMSSSVMPSLKPV